MSGVDAALATVVLYLFISLCYFTLPGWRMDGYACHWNGEPISYKLNGPLCLAVVVGVWAWLAQSGSELSWLSAAQFGVSCAVANGLGLIASVAVFKSWPLEPAHRCLTVDQTELRAKAKASDVMASLPASPERSTAAHFFYGLCFNPQLFGCDIKMGLYTLGACVLEWNLLSASMLHWQQEVHLSRALVTYTALFTWFLCECASAATPALELPPPPAPPPTEALRPRPSAHARRYLILECVHLYTYDIMCEKMGFKLMWGCFAFYPFFYCVGVWPLVAAPSASDISSATAAAIVLCFFGGWVLTRGANLQKYVYKTRPAGTPFACGLVANGTVPGTRLLCTGFWGVARHVNYLGEILQAVALALPGCLVAPTAGAAVLPWLYPLYYVALFVPRQADDDEQIRLKYGEGPFAEYVQRVPYRMVPGVW